MLKWAPNDWMTVNNLIIHLFTNILLVQVVSTLDNGYNNIPINIGNNGVRRFSNWRFCKRSNVNNCNNNVVNGGNNINALKNYLSDFIKVFNDMKGFDNLINNLKSGNKSNW